MPRATQCRGLFSLRKPSRCMRWSSHRNVVFQIAGFASLRNTMVFIVWMFVVKVGWLTMLLLQSLAPLLRSWLKSMDLWIVKYTMLMRLHCISVVCPPPHLLHLLVVLRKTRIILQCSCVNANVTQRLQHFIISKFQHPRALKDASSLPVIFTSQRSGCMDNNLFHNLFHHHFVPEVKDHFWSQGKSTDTSAVLLLDNCAVHPPKHQLVSKNIFTTYPPPNVMSLIQPMDQGVIQTMKCYYKKDFMRRLLNFEDPFADSHTQLIMPYITWFVLERLKEINMKLSWRKLYLRVTHLQRRNSGVSL